MAVELIGTTVGGWDTPAGSYAITLPSGIEAGDLIVLGFHGEYNAGTASLDSIPSGFTMDDAIRGEATPYTLGTASVAVLASCAKVATGDEGSTTVTFGVTGPYTDRIHAAVFRGVNTSAREIPSWSFKAGSGSELGGLAVPISVAVGRPMIGWVGGTFGSSNALFASSGFEVAEQGNVGTDRSGRLQLVAGTAAVAYDEVVVWSNRSGSEGGVYALVYDDAALPDELPVPVLGEAGDRLRSSISETTGSLLEAVDARAVDASVSEAYTYAQELPATTLVTYREVLRTRDSATADFAYYPQSRQNIVMENQYTGLTILGRLARYYPPRIYNDVVSLGLSGIPAATATGCIDYVLTQWAADNDWLTFETVPDLRVPMPGLVPSDYGVGTGQVFASTIAIKQDGDNRRDALSILRDLLSPFPGTVVRQNSAGNLEIVPASGPDADETAFVTLDTKDLYSVTIGKPNEFDTINRCVVSSTGGAEQSTDVAVMQPAWFQIGSSYQFGRSNWYTPPGTRTNLQPFEHPTNTTLQEGLTTSSNFNLQKPVLWPISGDAIPAGDGISLVSSGAVDQVTIAWARYFNDSLVSSGTGGLTIITDVIPFSGAWVDALSVSFSTGGESVFANIRMRWNETEQGIEIGLGTAKLETDCFTGCNGVIIEFVLADASTGYAEASPVTGSFGFVGDDPDVLPGVNSADAVLESQTALGIVERRIDIRGYVFDATTLYQIARGYVLNNITPKVTRELDVAALSGYRVLFDNIGRLHELPSGDVGFLTGVTYTDDFVSGIVRKTATVEVRDLAAAGAVDTTTDYLLMDDGSFWQSDDGSLSEAP